MHLGVWLFITITSILSGFSQGTGQGEAEIFITKILLFNSGYALIFYLSYFYIARTKAPWRIILLMGGVFSIPFVNFGHYYLLALIFEALTVPPMSLAIYFYYLGAGMIYTFGGYFLSRAETSREAEKRAEEAEKQREIAEANYLRSQINQHFLFNALNSIYVLSYKNDQKLPDQILRLSNILRYVVDQSKEALVPLSKELDLIENYLEIQRVRLPHNFKISFTRELEGEDMHMIPVVLITLVENCFKHGDLTTSGEIRVKAHQSKGTLLFETFNKIEEQKPQKEGDGLLLTQKRLKNEYGEKAELFIQKTDSTFSAKLSIRL